MGFATAENLTYVLQGGTSLAFFRMVTAVPAHFVFAVIMGYYLGIAKSKRKYQIFYICLSLIIPIFFHALYDYFLFMNIIPGMFIGGFVTLFIAFVFAKKAIVEHLESSPFQK